MRGGTREALVNPMTTFATVEQMPVDEVDVVGALDGEPWYGSGYFCCAGEPPAAAAPSKKDFDFSVFLTDKTFHEVKPAGWIAAPSNFTTEKEIVRFAPAVRDPDGERVWDGINALYYRRAVALGAVEWEQRADGKIAIARDAAGVIVAIIAPMRSMDPEASS